MARGGGRSGQKFAANPQGVNKALGFFSSVESDVGSVDQWDIKTELFADAVLGLIGAGYSVGLYAQWHGQAIVCRIYRGDDRDDHPIRDGIEFDRLMKAIVDKLAADRSKSAQ